MQSIDEIINESGDVREVKRALGIKLLEQGMSPGQISQVLNVSVQWVSKWKGKYETEGAVGLLVGYQGSAGYLSEEAKGAIVGWIEEQATVTVEAVRDYVESAYGVVYQSKESYYQLLEAGGMSCHQSEKANPKRQEAQVQERREVIKKNWRRTVPKSKAAS